MQLIASAAPAAEPQRLHILDWGRRMAGYEFSTPEQQRKPEKGRSHSKVMTHSQINSVLRSNHAPTTGMSINAHSASARERSPRAIAQSIAQLFGGGGGIGF
ncbi:hypothetical protein [Paraburkholderia sp. D1E]|uniref:hypothetical protein n=1 Tax=Paraburkholderia sp. D1E TaxID=3461398 RepID=UPI004045F409